MATEQERINSGRDDRESKVNGEEQLSGQNPYTNNPHSVSGANARDSERDQNVEDSSEKETKPGFPAGGLTKIADDVSHQTTSFHSEESRSTIRPDSLEPDTNKLKGKNESSDYIDADDEKELGTQSGTFFNDEQGTLRGF